MNSRGDIYLFFRVYSDLYGSNGDYYRTEIFQNYAINMVNKQMREISGTFFGFSVSILCVE